VLQIVHAAAIRGHSQGNTKVFNNVSQSRLKQQKFRKRSLSVFSDKKDATVAGAAIAPRQLTRTQVK
jgi:hypothetical protein